MTGISNRASLTAGWLIALVVLVLGSTGCAKMETSPREVRVAVVDGFRTDGLSSGSTIEMKGWWFGRREYFRNGNDGLVFGDLLAHEVGKIEGVEVHSRDDFRVFFSQKERLLRAEHPELTSAQRKEVVTHQAPVDFGRALNVDYVLRPVVEEAFMTTNKTFLWWYGRLVADVEVWDTRSGELVWTYKFKDTGSFRSQVGMMEVSARKMARKLQQRDVMALR